MDRRIGRILLGFVGGGLIVTALVLARARKPATARDGSSVDPMQTREIHRDRARQMRELLGNSLSDGLR